MLFRSVESIRSALQCALTARPAWTFRQSDARDTLRTHFGVTHLAGFGLNDDDAAIGPAGALLRYLQETQPVRDARGEAGREAASGGGARAVGPLRGR